MPHNSLGLLAAFLVGFGVGLVFFFGLWWTVRQITTSARPILWVLTSLVVRFAIVLAGFYWISEGQWQRMLACLAGFIIARIAVQWRIRYDAMPSRPECTEHGHAP